MTEVRNVDGLHPGACRQSVNVNKCPVGQPDDDRVPGNAGAVAQEPTQLGQVPAQSVEWIVRVAEQQLCQPLAARRRFGDQQIREQGPDLATTGGGLAMLSSDHARLRTQQMNSQRSRHGTDCPSSPPITGHITGFGSMLQHNHT